MKHTIGSKQVRDTLLRAGVKHLREFGYQHVNAENILTDMIYKVFFRRMLEGTLEDIPNDGMTAATVRELIKETTDTTTPESPDADRP